MNAATLNLIKSAMRLDQSMGSAERAYIIRLIISRQPPDSPADKPRPLSDTYLSPREAAAYLGFSKRTLARYVAEGRIRPSRLNARVLRFKRAALDALIAGDVTNEP